MHLHAIRGIQMTTTEKLATAGILTSDQLLAAGRTPAGREALASKISIDPKDLLELLNRADLARIRGIGEVYGNLLEQAGVDTVVELARRVPAHLHVKLTEQTKTGDARRAPTLAQVEDWVAQAKALGRGIEY